MIFEVTFLLRNYVNRRLYIKCFLNHPLTENWVRWLYISKKHISSTRHRHIVKRMQLICLLRNKSENFMNLTFERNLREKSWNYAPFPFDLYSAFYPSHHIQSRALRLGEKIQDSQIYNMIVHCFNSIECICSRKIVWV